MKGLTVKRGGVVTATAVVAALLYFELRIAGETGCAGSGAFQFKIGSQIYTPPMAMRPEPIHPITASVSGRQGILSKLRGSLLPCSMSSTERIEAVGFSFRLPPTAIFEGSSVSPSVRLTPSISPSSRPTAAAPMPAAVRSIDYSVPEVIDDGEWATFEMRISTEGGDTSSLDVRCQWADPIPPNTKGRPFNCRSVVLLDDGNTLELVASPRDGELSIIGESLMASLRLVSIIKQ